MNAPKRMRAMEVPFIADHSPPNLTRLSKSYRLDTAASQKARGAPPGAAAHARPNVDGCNVGA